MSGQKRRRQKAVAQRDLMLRAALVAGLWLVLYLLDASITQGVVIATLTAIFGPDVLRAGFGQILGNRGNGS